MKLIPILGAACAVWGLVGIPLSIIGAAYGPVWMPFAVYVVAAILLGIAAVVLIGEWILGQDYIEQTKQ